ncbi:MAG: endonuclease III domain-containing protein [Bacteroidota bacterium]
MAKKTIDWNTALKPLFKKYKGKKHPLAFENPYQLMVMIVMSARASDAMVNALAPAFFKKYPSFKHLAKAKPQELYPIMKVPGFRNKAEWIIGMAKTVNELGTIPESMVELTSMKGFGRKSANVFMSQTGLTAEGVIVDLHTLRVAPRLGIAEGDDPKKVELQLMEKVEKKNWHLLGMSLTYLGRETCRPTDPKCHECVMSSYCDFFNRK